MSQPIKTKNVFLTGGAQGLGRGFVDALLASGARVVFVDINPTVGAATERSFAEKYGEDKVRFIEIDVSDGPKLEEAFQAAVDHLGYVDLMVNNAAIMHEGVWEKMIQINYAGVVRGTMLAYEHMRMDKGGKGGRIINVSSIAGIVITFAAPVYCGLKHAVRAFTSSLAIAPDRMDLGIEYGILCPGPADTDLTNKADETKIRHRHLIKPEIMAKFVSPVERIQAGFMKLVRLEEMNGAMLLANQEGMHFQRLEQVNVGKNWPLPEEPSVHFLDKLGAAASD